MDLLLKKFISEIIGTFIFLSTIIVVVNRLKPSVNLLKIGLALSISIVIFGPISGGHFNPAVSYMFVRFPMSSHYTQSLIVVSLTLLKFVRSFGHNSAP